MLLNVVLICMYCVPLHLIIDSSQDLQLNKCKREKQKHWHSDTCQFNSSESTESQLFSALGNFRYLTVNTENFCVARKNTDASNLCIQSDTEIYRFRLWFNMSSRQIKC